VKVSTAHTGLQLYVGRHFIICCPWCYLCKYTFD